jgi:hypothetical protein
LQGGVFYANHFGTCTTGSFAKRCVLKKITDLVGGVSLWLIRTAAGRQRGPGPDCFPVGAWGRPGNRTKHKTHFRLRIPSHFRPGRFKMTWCSGYSSHVRLYILTRTEGVHVRCAAPSSTKVSTAGRRGTHPAPPAAGRGTSTNKKMHQPHPGARLFHSGTGYVGRPVLCGC